MQRAGERVFSFPPISGFLSGTHIMGKLVLSKTLGRFYKAHEENCNIITQDGKLTEINVQTQR